MEALDAVVRVWVLDNIEISLSRSELRKITGTCDVFENADITVTADWVYDEDERIEALAVTDLVASYEYHHLDLSKFQAICDSFS